MQYRYERKTGSVVYKSLKKQSDYLKDNWRDLYDNIFLWYFSRYGKFIDDSGENIDSLEEFWKAMGLYEMIDTAGSYVNKSILLGYKVGYRRHKNILLDFGISFDLQNPVVSRYMETFSSLHLSDKFGSISLTTKDAVLAELRKGVTESLSYQDIAKNIEALNPSIFSQSRAKLIATNEIGKAYEAGNYIPMYEVRDQGATVRKYRRTSRDDRVTPECSANEAEGWVGLEYIRPSGDKETTRDSNPRCRCYTKFDIK